MEIKAATIRLTRFWVVEVEITGCTFFGHRDCPTDIKSRLQEVLVELTVNQGVTMFYVGNQGCFDATVRSVLRDLKYEYPHIDYAVVLAYMPGRRNEFDDYSDTMLPEGIESIHPRYAISWRNDWMLQHANYVVTYITHSWGGAAQYASKAQKAGKRIIKKEPLTAFVISRVKGRFPEKWKKRYHYRANVIILRIAYRWRFV